MTIQHERGQRALRHHAQTERAHDATPTLKESENSAHTQQEKARSRTSETTNTSTQKLNKHPPGLSSRATSDSQTHTHTHAHTAHTEHPAREEHISSTRQETHDQHERTQRNGARRSSRETPRDAHDTDSSNTARKARARAAIVQGYPRAQPNAKSRSRTHASSHELNALAHNSGRDTAKAERTHREPTSPNTSKQL